MKKKEGGYHGYCVELLELLIKEFPFKYDLQLVGDDKYGEMANGTWNGMIGELIRKVQTTETGRQHRESKKGATLTMAITLSILDRFAKFFYCCKEQ